MGARNGDDDDDDDFLGRRRKQRILKEAHIKRHQKERKRSHGRERERDARVRRRRDPPRKGFSSRARARSALRTAIRAARRRSDSPSLSANGAKILGRIFLWESRVGGFYVGRRRRSKAAAAKAEQSEIKQQRPLFYVTLYSHYDASQWVAGNTCTKMVGGTEKHLTCAITSM